MAQHTFSPATIGLGLDADAIDPPLTPIQWYEAALQKHGFVSDAAQQQAIRELQRLYDGLIALRAHRHRPLLRPLVRWSRHHPAAARAKRWLRRQSWLGSMLGMHPPKGLYFWGGVGRGKSFLMDAFYECLPYKRKRRVHFHDFMHDIHQELRLLEGQADPLAVLAAKVARQYRVICFDEFHVSDIGDAMILARLLRGLFDLGVVLVMTSNFRPDDLYPNGLQRSNFLPAIDLIKARLKVINVDGGRDYRMRHLENMEVYLSPIEADTDLRLNAIFAQMSDDHDLNPEFVVENRVIHARRRSNAAVWFDFDELCNTPRSQNDYLALARQFATIIVSNVPRMGADMASPARRFTWLVDVLYDERVKLVLSAATHQDDLYTSGTHANEFFRTASRLQEMQSKDYLALTRRVVTPTGPNHG